MELKYSTPHLVQLFEVIVQNEILIGQNQPFHSTHNVQRFNYRSVLLSNSLA